MGFEKAFRASSYLLLFSGFISLFASEALGPIVTILYLLVLLASWRSGVIDFPGWVQLILFVVFVAFFVLDALTLSDFVTATVHLLLLVSLVKVFTLEAERDYWILYCISFGFLLFASAYTISISFLLTLILYIFSSILTFILFESKKAYQENRSAHFSLKGYSNAALVITALIILISVPIFVVIPRVSFGLFRVDRRLDLNMSGFSDKLSLGDIGEIIVNSNVVMRVRLDTERENLPSDLKWRGISLDHYDGRDWFNTRDRYRRLRSSSLYGGILVSENRRHNEFLVEQSIFLEPFSNVIFGAPEMILITGNILSRTFMFEDGNGSLGIYRRVRGPLKYVVYSDLMSREEKLNQPLEGTIPEVVQERYLQLPELHPSIYQLADELTVSQSSPVEKALAIERFLKENYGYSLDNRSASANDPLYDFLMESKVGHCEYFATAQAILMRTIGIPTRVVNGFRIGEFNRFSDYFIVRQSDAHSWVEGYFSGPGWVEFDSTPLVDTGLQGLAITRWFSQLLDSIDAFWIEVITFDRVRQIGVFRSLRSSVRNTWNEISRISSRLDEIAKLRWLDRFTDWNFAKFVYFLLSSLMVATLWIAHRYRRYLRIFWKQWFSKKVSSSIAPEYYLEMLDLMGRKGLVKRSAETPLEFVERIQTDLSSPAPALITQLYYRNRFGHFPLGASDLSNVYGWLRELHR
ncbi:DUF3488 and transglutaminase-like domain-containing protein [Acidobacteria bacterium AH-259-D05]|nr:DUF3488 and transglutaminase-like domain-containing protein [Acidobacteria bacterium AH-259-D05]